MLTTLLCVVAYLLGGLPFGLWVGRLKGVDLRLRGSGNIGATNAGRILGRPFGFLVFGLDALKGLAPVVLARLLGPELGTSELSPVLCAVAAVLGHMFPPLLRFRGGKGVATAAGAFLALHFTATLLVLAVWFVVLLATRWVALASLLAAWSFPPIALFLPAPGPAVAGRGVVVLSVGVALLITLRHRANIGRMLKGTEPRVGLPG